MSRWSIVIEPAAQKDLRKLGGRDGARVLRFLYDRIGKLDDPRKLGSPLKGTLAEYWRYRVGDCRILCRIEDNRLIVLGINIGKRREIYR
jgi:mRNA interferase RelE/StbE